MSKKNDSIEKFFKLVRQYQIILWMVVLFFIVCLVSSLLIYYHLEDHSRKDYWFKIADFLMSVGQAIMGTLLVGGGLGGIINFILEEQQDKEENAKQIIKGEQEHEDRRKSLSTEIRTRMQQVHDDVQLARILIKSHRSGRTYGEQIRDRIMPAEITLQDIKRQLLELESENLIDHLPELEVSLTYMAAYLSTLIEEFSIHYLDIANLQNYQDELARRRRTVFTQVLEQNNDTPNDEGTNTVLLEQVNELFQPHDVPDRIETVWDAMQRLDFVWDFIADLRDEKGKSSQYQDYFIDHHFHCLRILRSTENAINTKICNKPDFQKYLKLQQELKAKKRGEHLITKSDSLTRTIMIEGLQFDFE